MLTNSAWKYQTFYSFADLSEDAFADILDKAIWHPDTPVVENTFVDKKVFKEPIDKSFSVLIKQTNNRENDLEEAPDLENAVLYVKYDPETDVIEICDHEKARKEFNEIMQKAALTDKSAYQLATPFFVAKRLFIIRFATYIYLFLLK